MATHTIDATIFASSHPDIVKRSSVSGIIISCIMLLVGTLSFAFTFGMDNRASILSMSLMTLGTGLLLLGVFRMFWISKEIVYLPTGSVAKEYTIFFDLKYMESLTELVDSGSFSDEKIKGDVTGNIRMDVILSEDKKFAAVQLFQFIPYNYQPVTEVRYFTDEEASGVAAFLATSKK